MGEYGPDAVSVRAPATSANLGPGFDALGLCLGLHDDVTASVSASGLVIDLSGEGSSEVPRDEQHLVVRSLRAALDLLGGTQPGLRVRSVNRIPHGRGLGSSAAAIVAGIRLAQGLMPGSELSDDTVLSLASELEGHPDNVAACLLGGLTVAWSGADGVGATRLDVDPRIRAHVLVPPHAVSTEAARGLLPARVPHRDAAANAGRSALLVAALTQRPELLLVATQDRLHQSYRGKAMPQTIALVEELRAQGAAAAVSGAGPSVLVLDSVGAAASHAAHVPTGWTVLDLAVDADGCRWQRSDPVSPRE